MPSFFLVSFSFNLALWCLPCSRPHPRPLTLVRVPAPRNSGEDFVELPVGRLEATFNDETVRWYYDGREHGLFRISRRFFICEVTLTLTQNPNPKIKFNLILILTLTAQPYSPKKRRPCSGI